jgi:UPF0716 protein FxsA
VGRTVLAAVVVAVLEIIVFVLVARWIGLAWTVLLVLIASLLGGWLLRREGVRAWRRFRAVAEAGQPPGAQVVDGLVGLVGALLLAVPGLLTGLSGAVLLVPPVRKLLARRAERTAERRLSPAAVGDLFGPRRVRVQRGDPIREPAAEPPQAQPPVGAGPAAPGPAEPGPGPTIEGEIVGYDERRRD